MDDKPKRALSGLRLCINHRAGDVIPSCGASGSHALKIALEDAFKNRDTNFTFETSHCLGFCHMGPTLRLIPAGPFLVGVKPDNVEQVLDFIIAKDFDGLAAAFPMPEPKY